MRRTLLVLGLLGAAALLASADVPSGVWSPAEVVRAKPTPYRLILNFPSGHYLQLFADSLRAAAPSYSPVRFATLARVDSTTWELRYGQ